jgi:hypothetical protein
MVLAVSGAIGVYLNFQGYRCQSDLARLDSSVLTPKRLEEMESSCSIITNSYVYSIYGVIAGTVLVIIGFVKRKRNLS